MTDRYAVLGNPVSHSKSPQIHLAFASQTGEHLDYRAIEVAVGHFADAVTALHSEGYRGLNVTVPFKVDAFELSSSLSERAKRAGAVNTLLGLDSGWHGDNTDGTGLLRDLQHNAGVQLEGKRILLLGAGGAVRGVLMPLLQAQPALLHIANRTEAKAIELAADFATLGNISGSGLALNQLEPFDIIINGTAASLQGDLPPLPSHMIQPHGFCYDMMYGAAPTVFLQWAASRGADIRDGLGMLVEQAAEAFALWRGVRPDTATVLRELRSSIQA